MGQYVHALRAGIRSGVAEILEGHRPDSVVGLCLFSDADAQTLGVVANSAENLERRRTAERPDADPVGLRWQPDFWDLGPERASTLNDLISTSRPRLTPEQLRADDWGAIAAFADRFFADCVEALVSLRAEGYFAEVAPRAVLAFKVSEVLGSFAPEIEAVRLLNSAGDADQLADWAARFARTLDL